MANIIIAIATVVIAVYAIMSYKLASKIQSRDDEFRQEARDLYQAIAISNLIDPAIDEGSGQWERAKKLFNKYYTGKTPIFD